MFPVAFESGKGCTLTDVDGNVYIDFSSGIYVTGLGHCHPKVTEAVQRAAGELMNAHDFTTPIKMRLMEKLAEITMGEGDKKLTGLQLYDSGTTAVEAGLRVMRAATGKFEFISFHTDFHGKTMGAVGLARLDASARGCARRASSSCPRGNCYRCEFRQKYPDVRPAVRRLHPHRHPRGDGRPRGRHRPRADPGLGRQRRPAGRLLPEAARSSATSTASC